MLLTRGFDMRFGGIEFGKRFELAVHARYSDGPTQQKDAATMEDLDFTDVRSLTGYLKSQGATDADAIYSKRKELLKFSKRKNMYAYVLLVMSFIPGSAFWAAWLWAGEFMWFPCVLFVVPFTIGVGILLRTSKKKRTSIAAVKRYCSELGIVAMD